MSFTATPVAGQKIRAATVSALISELRPVAARKTSDQTVNNSAVLVNDTELLVPVAANTVYDFKVRLRYTTGTTPDIKVTWTFPTGLTMNYTIYVVAASTAVLLDYDFDQTLTAVLEGHASSVKAALLEGRVKVGANAGTLQLQWAQSTANGSNTVMKTDSSIELRQVE